MINIQNDDHFINMIKYKYFFFFFFVTVNDKNSTIYNLNYSVLSIII